MISRILEHGLTINLLFEIIFLISNYRDGPHNLVIIA